MADSNKLGLCYRCEWRARYHEHGHAPRCQCGDTNGAVWCCYMYKPVLPVWTGPANKDDDRPRFGPAMIASREAVLRVAEEGKDGRYRAIVRGDDVLVSFRVHRRMMDHWRVFCNRVVWPVLTWPRRMWWRTYYRTIGRVVEWWQERQEGEDEQGE